MYFQSKKNKKSLTFIDIRVCAKSVVVSCLKKNWKLSFQLYHCQTPPKSVDKCNIQQAGQRFLWIFSLENFRFVETFLNYHSSNNSRHGSSNLIGKTKHQLFSSVHHFSDDTNLLLIDKSLKKINKYINRDLKCAVDWIRANKLSLNTSKTEIVLFKTRNKIITKRLNFRISGQKIELSKSVKYLGIIQQDDLY